MATTVKIGELNYIEENGDQVILYPIVKAECVNGLDVKINELLSECTESEIDSIFVQRG